MQWLCAEPLYTEQVKATWNHLGVVEQAISISGLVAVWRGSSQIG